jgi:Rieske Fe-S protein
MPVVKHPDLFPIAAADEYAVDRRRFLCAAGAATVLVLGGEGQAHRATPSAPPERLVLPDAGTLAVGEARALDTPAGVHALAIRVDATTVVAFDRRCPHLGCPVMWAAARGRFECPCHDAVFDARTGRVLTGPPRRGLTPLRVETA